MMEITFLIFLCCFGLLLWLYRRKVIKEQRERDAELEELERRYQANLLRRQQEALSKVHKEFTAKTLPPKPKTERSKFREEARVDHLSQNFTSQNSRLNEDNIKQIGDIVEGVILAASVYMHPSEPESPVIVSGGGGDFGGGGASDSWESSSSSSDSNTSGD